MGFLDHSTNNIILDCVLTDVGRSLLAKNDGSFSIHKFALSDDEIVYNIIEKYGRTVGKEKIEKNTPVAEALTNQSHAQKYLLVSVSNPNLIRLPSLRLDNSTTDTITLKASNSNSNLPATLSVTLNQIISDQSTIDVELRDQSFLVQVPNLFAQINNATPENIDAQQKATYILPRTGTNNFGGSNLTFTLSAKSLSQALFTVYGTTQSKNQIKSYIKISGLQSGATKEITLIISNV